MFTNFSWMTQRLKPKLLQVCYYFIVLTHKHAQILTALTILYIKYIKLPTPSDLFSFKNPRSGYFTFISGFISRPFQTDNFKHLSHKFATHDNKQGKGLISSFTNHRHLIVTLWTLTFKGQGNPPWHREASNGHEHEVWVSFNFAFKVQTSFKDVQFTNSKPWMQNAYYGEQTHTFSVRFHHYRWLLQTGNSSKVQTDLNLKQFAGLELRS